ncbi:hypothetical protein SAMN06273572_10381 [Monaibacterium marinum]|uniref:FAR-17a/AIG1-like protein n=2 Tax=Pontivivens marinum TaxID=1690039 RepID=A0A2C9CRS4_9RHOB|nr:hypothetical protein SAMN06273572_10381 [Monaibacterium marinum]
MKLELAIATIAFTALMLQTYLNLAAVPDLIECVWRMLTFFSILANLGIALVMSRAVSQNELPSPRTSGAITVWAIVVGTFGHSFMHEVMPSTTLEITVDHTLHTIVPVSTILWWVLRAPKDGLTLFHVALWAVYPGAYLIYAMTRGAAEGFYPYPFIDPDISSTQTIILWLGALIILCVTLGLTLVAASRSVFFQRV